MLRIYDASDTVAFDRLLAREQATDGAFNRRIRRIVDGVRTGGDGALEAFARRFDGVTGPLEVSAAEMRAAAATVPRDVRRAIAQASQAIARVAKTQLPATR